MSWTADELKRVGGAEELRIATHRRNGGLRAWVTIWVVRDGDALYVRSVNGRGSSWFRGASASHRARISAGGVERDVALTETRDADDAVDAAYAGKYRRHAASIIEAITGPAAREATLRLSPEDAS